MGNHENIPYKCRFIACWDQKNSGFSSKVSAESYGTYLETMGIHHVAKEVFSWEYHRGKSLCEFSTMELIEDIQLL